MFATNGRNGLGYDARGGSQSHVFDRMDRVPAFFLKQMFLQVCNVLSASHTIFTDSFR